MLELPGNSEFQVSSFLYGQNAEQVAHIHGLHAETPAVVVAIGHKAFALLGDDSGDVLYEPWTPVLARRRPGHLGTRPEDRKG